MEEQSLENRKVASDLDKSRISFFDNHAYGNELTFVPANVISDGEEYKYNPKNKTGKFDFDIDSGSSDDMPEKYCHFKYGEEELKMKYTL